MISSCSKEKLEEFSKKHFTYINQIFGDATVRQIIEEEYPTTYEFKIEFLDAITNEPLPSVKQRWVSFTFVVENKVFKSYC